MFEDFNDGNGADDGSANTPFRLLWQIPEHYRDGAWHDLAITLPPTTWQALEDAKANGFTGEDSLAQYWIYGGSWSSGGFGVATDLLGPNTSERPDLWHEYEWNSMHGFGIFFDSNGGGGPVYVDDFYIGPRDLDISAASGVPAAMSGVTVAGDGPQNLISWTHNPDFGGYRVYFSESPITDVSADGVELLSTIPFSADAFEVRHSLEAPHPSFGLEV